MAPFYGWGSTASMLHVLAAVLTMLAKRNIIFMTEQEHAYPNKKNKELGAIIENLSICSQ